MDLTRLRCFVVVAEELSFTRAASRLRFAQPWVSSQIRRLEQELGIDLFERSTRSVRLTRSAERLLPEVRRLLDAEEEARASVVSLLRDDRRDFRIGMPSHLAISLRYREVADFLEKWSTSVHVHNAPSVDLVPALQRGELDIAFLSAPLPSADLRVETIEEGPLVLLVPEDHGLAAHDVIPATALAGQQVLTFGRHHNVQLWDRHVGALASLGAVLVEALEPSPAVLFRAAPAAGLPTLMHPWSAEWMGPSMGMVPRRIEGDPCGYTVLLARRAGACAEWVEELWASIVARRNMSLT
ncbi:LysR family transcriptional regulator [Nocardioides sp.]|uniref:LysR family transcriptional regulator n=1 Tax=Nocardioides sp. TaxID=35761 RepID=UPI0039E46362